MKVLTYLIPAFTVYGNLQTSIEETAELPIEVLCKAGQSNIYNFETSVDGGSISSAQDVISTTCDFLELKLNEYAVNGTMTITLTSATNVDEIGDGTCIVVYMTNTEPEMADIHAGLLAHQATVVCPEHEFRSEGVSPFERLNGYGCYCKLDDPDFVGHGRPYNTFDEMCYITQQGYLCANSDSSSIEDSMRRRKRSSFECSHDFTGYFVVTGGGIGITESCELFNNFLAIRNGWNQDETDCAIDKCKIDSNIILYMLSVALGHAEPFDSSGIWVENGGTFDRAVECGERLHPNVMPKVDECCGFYPGRRMLRRSEECCRGNDFESPYHRRLERCCEVDGHTSIVSEGQCEGEIV